MENTIPAVNLNKSLPLDGFSRWSGIKIFSPVARDKFYKLAKAGLAPQPIKLSSRCTVYSNRELHRWFANPLAYRAEAAK